MSHRARLATALRKIKGGLLRCGRTSVRLSWRAFGPPELAVSEIFKEVDEEVRQERYLQLWKQYGAYAIAGVAGVVVLTAGFMGWQEYQRSAREAESVHYTAALRLSRIGDTNAAADAFGDLAASTSSGYGVLARLQQAGALAPSSSTAAVELYDRIAADSGVPKVFRDLARLRAAMLLIDTTAPNDLYPRFEPLIGDDNPWRFVAREMKALVDLQAGNVEEARAAYKRLVDDADAPQGVRARAAEMLAMVGVEN